MGNQQTNNSAKLKRELQAKNKKKPVIYNDRLQMIIKYQFEQAHKQDMRKATRLHSELKDEEFVFTEELFNRIFAPTTKDQDMEDLKFKFELDMQRLNGKLKSLSPWITDHNGRLGICILGDAINYSINYGTKDMYKFFDQAIGISYLMHSNKELYFTYNLVQRVQLAAPLVHLESIQANEWFIEMMNWNKTYADHNHMDHSVTVQLNKLIANGDSNLKTLQKYGLFPRRDAIMDRSSTVKSRRDKQREDGVTINDATTVGGDQTMRGQPTSARRISFKPIKERQNIVNQSTIEQDDNPLEVIDEEDAEGKHVDTNELQKLLQLKQIEKITKNIKTYRQEVQSYKLSQSCVEPSFGFANQV